jgi:hypothetical protein
VILWVGPKLWHEWTTVQYPIVRGLIIGVTWFALMRVEGSSIRFPLSVLCVKESTGSPSKSRRLSLGLQIGLIYLLYVEESPTHLMRESS